MEGLAETILELIPDADPQARGLYVERLSVELPLELYVRRGDGQWRIESSAPTQRIQTTVLPVFHRVTLVMQARAEEAKRD
jgi:hypothetical protein